jgi:hypothetical protein
MAITTTSNAQYIPTIIARTTLQRLAAYLSMAKNVSKDTDFTTAQEGQILSIPKTGAVSTNDKVQGSSYTVQSPTATNNTTVTLNKHKEVTLSITDPAKVMSNQDTLNSYGEDGAIAIAEAVESDLLALHTSMTNTVTWNRTSAATIDSSLLAIRRFFTDQKVPVLEQKFLNLDSSVYNDLLGQEKYTNASWRGANSAVDEGRMLKVYGLEITETQLIPTTGSPVAYHNVAYTRNGFILASRPLAKPEGFGGQYNIVVDKAIGIAVRTLYWYNADKGEHQLTIEVLYGVNILDTRRVLEVESF